jgi:hypothetical protein
MSHVLPNDGPGMPSSTNVINVRFDFLPPFELKIIYGNNHALKTSGLNPDKGQIPCKGKFTMRNAKPAASIVQK